jgi:hypothetical protein
MYLFVYLLIYLFIYNLQHVSAVTWSTSEINMLNFTKETPQILNMQRVLLSGVLL